MNNDDHIEQLNERYKEILSSISKSDYRKLNLRTVGNYITFYSSIDDANKKFVFNQLITYLDLVKSAGLNVPPDETYMMYSEYLDPLVNFYRKLGFEVYFAWRNLLYFLLPLNLLLGIFNLNIVFFIIANSIFIIIKLRSEYLKFKHMVYAPFF